MGDRRIGLDRWLDGGYVQPVRIPIAGRRGATMDHGAVSIVSMISTGSIVTEPTPALADATASFDDRYAALRPRLLAICTGLVGIEAAEDVVQDVYLRGRGRYGQLRDPVSFAPWLVRMAINLCYNRHRSRRRLLERLPLLARRQPSAVDRDLGLRELIEQLADRERTLIVLHYGYGYPIGEIARLLDLSPTNARSVLFRARTRLAEQLREAER
jgi:RNA polymerase sigma factor (sigma-70 family)